MSARRRGRILHGFQTQRAFALLLPVDPTHGLVVIEIVAMRAFAAAGSRRHGSVGDASEVLALRFGVCGAGSFEEERR